MRDGETEWRDDLPPSGEIVLWATFVALDDGFYTFTTKGIYYDALYDTTETFSASIEITVVWDFSHPVGITDYTVTTGADYIEFKVTIKNYGENNVTVTLALSAIAPDGSLIRPAVTSVIAAEGTTIVTLTVTVPASGDYPCEVMLLTGLPLYGGYCLEYVVETVTV